MDIYSFSNNINQEAELIIDCIEEESLSVYVFLVNVFSMSDATENLVFQFVFRSFYQYESIDYNRKYWHKYFQVMQNYRYKYDLQLDEIYKQLIVKEQEKATFSLTTKLLNMIEPKYPIYHYYSEYVFPFLQEPIETNQLFNHYIVRYYKMIDLYKQIISNNLLKKTLDRFDQKFIIYELPETKKLDFIFAAYGKLLKNKTVPLRY